MIPQTQEERDAVRKELQRLRKKNGSEESGSNGDYVSLTPRPAQITVRLPADARLYIDDTVCPLTSATRSFKTPALQPGKEYFYTLRAEVTRDGERRTQTRRVAFTAGRQLTVEFTDFTPLRTARR